MKSQDKEKMKSFMDSQIDEINKHKWIESEKANYDLGDVAVKDWIKKHAANFRKEWERQNTESSGTE